MQFRKHAYFPNRVATSNCDIRHSVHWRRVLLLIAAVAAATIITVVLLTASANNQPQAPKGIQLRKSSAGTMQGSSVRFEQVPVDEHGVLRYTAVDGDTEKDLSVKDWIRLVSDPSSSDLARSLTNVLKEAPYEAYRFETPGVSPETVSGTRFEFVLVEDAYLAGFSATPDPNTFADYLSSPSCESDNERTNTNTHNPPAGCVFTNLGGDATLVAPRDWSPESSPSMYSSCYGHIANFMRRGPEQQVLQMWNTLGKTLGEKLLMPSTPSSVETSKPLWFSTAGDGVAYLHFRLDSRPKYYHYGAFRKFPTKNP